MQKHLSDIKHLLYCETEACLVRLLPCVITSFAEIPLNMLESCNSTRATLIGLLKDWPVKNWPVI